MKIAQAAKIAQYATNVFDAKSHKTTLSIIMICTAVIKAVGGVL